MELPGITFAEAERRQRIRRLSPNLPLDTSEEEIERLERERKNGGENLQASRKPTDQSGNPWDYPRPEDCVIEPAPVPLEKSVQHDVKQAYEAAGCTVYNLSQPRASKQTPGLGDLYVFHDRAGISFWHESKRPGGDLSDAQREFREHCIATRTKHVSGGVEEARVAIARWGLRP